ncbi:MAG: hypothetical protein SGJ18_01030 [Pseudomonadota bacterium]|nr:hypothetical protein [Pseudomonadota bacterium]
MNSKEQEWLKDFQEFVNAEGVPVPPAVSESILQYVHKALSPAWYIIFIKILTVHLVTGTLSLAVCSQFGMNPFNSGFSLVEYFMKFGHSTCMVFCGVLFVGMSFFVSGFLMRPEELRVLRKSALIQSLGLGFLSLLGFWLFGAEIAAGIALLWLIGALIGGVSTSEIIFRWRLQTR